MSNEKVGKLTIIRDDPTAPAYVITKCECGRERSIKRGELNRQKKKGNSVISCGICTYEEYAKEMLNQKYGNLTVLDFRIVDNTFSKLVEVLCKCDCGVSEPFWWKGADLKQGRKKACGQPGCPYVRRHDQGTTKSKHGTRISDEETRLRKRWDSMHRRCYDTKHASYEHYGKAGIEVDAVWHQSNPEGRSNFIKWFKEESSKEYVKKLKDPTIDRIESSKNYGPDNCRLATKSMQSANQKRIENATNRYKHISVYKSKTKNVGLGTKIALGYESVGYACLLPFSVINEEHNEKEALIIAYYIKYQMSLWFTTMSNIDFDVEIATLEETKSNARFYIAADAAKNINGVKYKKYVRYNLLPYTKIPGLRSVKIKYDNKTYITKVAFNVDILKTFIS